MKPMRWILTMLICGVWLGLPGCQKPLFTDKEPRSPYERYQVLHNDFRQSKDENIYGNTQPALRDRLRPLDR